MTAPATTALDRRAALEATIAGVYEAFGRGDVPAILAVLADDVRWEDWPDLSAQRDPAVPHLVPRRGPEGVAGFFGQLATFTFHELEVRSLLSGDGEVAACVVADFSMPNGGRLRDEEIHWWEFDDAGKVIAFRHYCDTGKHRAAATGVDTTR